MRGVTKHELKFKKTYGDDDKYEVHYIVGLENCYYILTHEGILAPWTFGGAAALLMNPEYEGYCTLCMVYNTKDSDSFGQPGYTMEFAPLYDKDENLILIKYDRDVTFCTIDRGYTFGKEKCDACICFVKNGIFTEFNPKNE